MMNFRRFVLCGFALAVAGATAGCSRDISDLEQDINSIMNRPPAPIDPVPEMKPFENYDYPEATMALRSPFAVLEFGAGHRGKSADTSGPRPDPSRPREELEEFPLDALRMVGTLQQHGSLWALVRDPGGTIHRVQEDNYLGQNHGRIVSIDERQVALSELVPNGQGGWIQRQASLALKE